MNQEYPSTLEEAFEVPMEGANIVGGVGQGSTGRRFSEVGL